MNDSTHGRTRYVLAMFFVWVGLYTVAILALNTVGCSKDSEAPDSGLSQALISTPPEIAVEEAVAEMDTSMVGDEVAAVSADPATTEVVPVSVDPAATETESTSIRFVSLEEGERLYNERCYQEAARALKAYTDHKPENAWGYYMLGLSRWKSDDLTGAAVALEKALAIDGDFLKGHINLARVFLADGNYSDAHRHALFAVGLNPNQCAPHRILGRTYHNLGMAEEAIDAYRAALAIDSRDAWSLNNIGLILIEEERFQESLAPLARSIQLRGDVAAFRNNLGVALERTGRYLAAAESYRSALEIENGYTRSATSLARVEQLNEESGLEPWDLELLAQRFVQEMTPDTLAVTLLTE